MAAAFASPKETVPGPLTLLHVTARALPAGRPSSEAVPATEADAGMVTVASGPASTTGARLVGAEPPDSTAPMSGAVPEKPVTCTATSPLGSV